MPINDQIDELRAEIEREKIAKDIFLKSLDLFKGAFPGRINQILKNKEEGKKIVGTLCLYVAERYLKIPCACMYPNDRRIDQIINLARDFNIEGVVYYTLQFCLLRI